MSEVTEATPEVMEESREEIEQILNNEVPTEPIKMKKPRAKAKAAAVAISKEDIMEAVKEATKKPVPDKPDKNK
eukprot:16432707-Heterocapsa_arctica.AAC.1